MRTCWVLVAAALGACSTPQVVMDQANNTVGLVAQLETSLTEFRRVEKNAEDARRRSIKDQLVAIEAVKKDTNQSSRARKSAGDAQTAAMIEQLIADAKGIADDDAAYYAALKSIDATLEGLGSPLPRTKAATAEVQKKLAELGVELSSADRRAEFKAFVSAVRKAVDENKKKIDEAEAKAKTGK